MWNKPTREEIAEMNKGSRIEAYGKLACLAALAAVGPMGVFVTNNILNAPEPISRTFTGYETEQVPMGNSYETYDYQYASSDGEGLHLVGFFLGILAAVALALLFYCFARFVVDPLMHKIDLHTEPYSNVQLWSKRCIMAFVVALFCATVVFSVEYDKYPDDEYVWLSDGQGTEYRVNKEEYEKYSGDSVDDENYEMGPQYEPPANYYEGPDYDIPADYY